MEFVRKAIALNHTFIILIIVGIAFTCHNEWQEVEALEIGNQRIDEFRKEVNRIHIRLIEFSLLGETVLDWDETDLENYHAQRIALDSILCSFNVTHDMSVMIFGENGTGKEHIAHHLHDKSKRTGKPFVAVDCGSLSKNLRRRHSSDTSRERLQVRTAPRKGISMKRKAARCFWTRWETSRWKPNRCCSVPYKRGGIARLVTNRTGVSMSASSPPPTRIWK